MLLVLPSILHVALLFLQLYFLASQGFKRECDDFEAASNLAKSLPYKTNHLVCSIHHHVRGRVLRSPGGGIAKVDSTVRSWTSLLCDSAHSAKRHRAAAESSWEQLLTTMSENLVVD